MTKAQLKEMTELMEKTERSAIETARMLREAREELEIRYGDPYAADEDKKADLADQANDEAALHG